VTDPLSLDHYQRTILAAWRNLPCTRGNPPPTDRALLRSLFQRGFSLPLILAAFRLASARRSPDLPPVRSIAYFRTVFDELADADPSYIDYLNARQ
jgi:hypothetical protein